MDRQGLRRGIDLFNEARYFEAHEVLEDVWRVAPAAEKRLLQGLVQLAVAFHHHSTGNLTGAGSLLKRAERNLADSPAALGGIQLDQLLREIASWRSLLEQQGRLPAHPRLEITEC